MDSNHKMRFYPMTNYLLARNPIKSRFGMYLAKLLDKVELSGDDVCTINQAKRLIQFHCSFITFNRLMAAMGDLFLYQGLAFNECIIQFKKGKMKTEKFSLFSPNVIMLIEMSEPCQSRMEIKINKEDYE